VSTLQKAKNEGILIAQLVDKSQETPSDDCVLCNLFFGVQMPASQKSSVLNAPNALMYELRAYSFLQFTPQVKFEKRLGARYIPQLCVVPAGCNVTGLELLRHVEKVGSIFVTSERELTEFVCYPRLIDRHIDFSIIKEWLAYCQCNHKKLKLCKSAAKHTSGMKVIDCNKACPAIISAPKSCSYAALSYVWGETSPSAYDKPLGELQAATCLPEPLPCTISDSIEVCKSLGIRYLWVDRYCIDQLNAEEVHEQVNQMDSIYGSAVITLIAAAGLDVEFGLPGAGSTPREASLGVRVGNFQVVATKPHPYWEIPESKWATRGWTFQEGVLSRRCLAFTQSQVYFECGGMNCCETLKVDLDFTYRKTKPAQYAFMHSGLFDARSDFSAIDRHDDDHLSAVMRARNLIHEFTGRFLKLDSDSIRAFAGILRKLGTDTIRIQHIWGLPFREQDYSSFGIPVQFVASLMWSHLGSACRRLDFPTWSWAGWKGQVDFAQADRNFLSCQGMSTFWLQIRLEDHEGVTRTIESCVALSKQGASPSVLSYPSAICLEGFVISPQALRFHFHSETIALGGRQSRPTLQGPAIGIGEYRVQIVFLEFGKLPKFVKPPELEKRTYSYEFYDLALYLKDEGTDLWFPDVRIYFSDSSHYAQNMPDLLKTGELELFVVGPTDFSGTSVSGLVIENKMGTNSRTGIWNVDLPCRHVFECLELEKDNIRKDWLVERTVRLSVG
jgi:hypothetical protein